MREKLRLLAVFLACALGLNAQISFSEAATSVGVARHDRWSAFHNVATLAMVEKADVSAAFRNRYAEKEFSTVEAGAAFGTKIINVGAAFASFGFSEFREGVAALGVSRKIGRRFALGVQCDYYFVHYSSLGGSRGRAIVQAGFLAQPVDDFYVGFQVFNPGFAWIRHDGLSVDIPAVFQLGVSYWFTPKVVAAASVSDDIRRDVGFSVEVDYFLYEKIHVRAFCQRQGAVMPGLGCGARFGAFAVDAAFSLHSTLGVVSDVSLGVRL